MPKRRALIVAVNPMPRLYIVDLVRTLAATHDVSVVTFYRHALLDSDLTQRVVAAGGTVVQRSHRGRLDYFRQLRWAADWLREWLGRDGPIDIFHCQPNHLLTNYLTFAGRQRFDYQVHLIPDGLANFYTVALDPYLRQMRMKRLIGSMLSLPYKVYSGDYLAVGEASYASYWHVGNPGLMSGLMRCHQFEVKGRPEVEQPDHWLFLGQPTPNEMAASEVDDLLRAVRSQFGPSGHYKPHPAEDVSASRAALLSELGVKPVHFDGSGEVFAASYGAVVGIASSVLVNIRMLGWGGQVYSVMDADHLARLTGRSGAEMHQVVSALRRLGVQSLAAE